MTRASVAAAAVAAIVSYCLLAGAAAAASGRPSALPEADPAAVGMDPERLARIGPVMQRYIDEGLVPGTVTAIMRRGRLVHFEVRGSMDVEGGQPMAPDTIFRIASMTKPITSVALMMLWEQGAFQLRDPVADFLPEFADAKVSTTGDASGQTGELVAPERPMTVRDLLTHTAGLANNYIGNTEFYRETMQARPEDDLAAYIERLASLPLNYHPGTAWQYSAATDVVGRLVEVLSGRPLDRFLAEEIFDPLGMTDTRFFLDDDRADRLAAQYRPGEDLTIELDDPAGAGSRWVSGPKKLFRGAGGLVSTASDYLRFQQMMLNGGTLDGVRLLAPATVSLMLENHTGDLPLWLPGPGMGFGLGYGIVLDRGETAMPMSVGTAYWGGAYCTLSWIDPEQELVAVLMTQVRPYTHLDIRQDFQVLTYQAIVE
ncbi:MAG: serine hydrolase [Gammaproteobacteria bacterium]|nr:serine hydrolase [Gammaproteobacteria bacterium]|tara:strand:- start:1200 stop:2486 length:1287 start_codon:yes stop_codon:yes gene_type:complete